MRKRMRIDFRIAEVRPVSVDFEVFRFSNRTFYVVHQDPPIAVESALLNVANAMLMYLVVDFESHSIDEEVAPMMMQRFCLTMMFDGRVVLAVDVQDDFVVKDVLKSQQWSSDVKDVEPRWEADVVAHKQDVSVTIDVNRLVGSSAVGRASRVQYG